MIDHPSVKVKVSSVTVTPPETFETTCAQERGETELLFILNRNSDGNSKLTLNINNNQCYFIDWQVAKSILELIKPSDSQ